MGAAIPAYNAERWLAQAIESLLAQTARLEDILVLDDGSNDGTAAVVAGFGDRVRVVSQPNSGIGAARNRAVELVRGEIVAFLDADDLYTPSSIATRLDVLLKRPHVGVVFGHERRFRRDTRRGARPDRSVSAIALAGLDACAPKRAGARRVVPRGHSRGRGT